MALTRPVLLPVSAFDATKQQTFIFTVPGVSSQIVANQLIVRKQSDNSIVYQEKLETFKYEHAMNADELENGTYYNATVSIFDAENNQSPESIPIQFYCYTTPTLSFTNLPLNNIVQNSSYNFEFEYNQTEQESLNTYIVNLYNVAGSIISSSGTQYVQNGTPPYSNSYLIVGLENATVYGIEVIGTTINGTIVSTGKAEFTVQYIHPDIFTLVELTNNCDEGYVSVRSNIVAIEGESNPDPPIYIDNKEVDLTDPDSWVEWNKGYKINGDFLARLWFRNPNLNSVLLTFSNTSGQTIQVFYREGYENVNSKNTQSYIEVFVNSIEENSYYIFSNFIDTLEDTQYYNFWLTRESNIYKIQLAAV